MRCVSETQTLPPVQVFDKTMVVKQMHVLEPQDLLITRADKGRRRPQEEEEGYWLTLSWNHPLIHPPFFLTVFTAHLLSHYSYFTSVISLCAI